MEGLEGYVGIRLWNEQLVDDIIFIFLVGLFILFAIIYRFHMQLFFKMWKDTFLFKPHQSLFDERVKQNDFLFYPFMIFQAFYLCSMCVSIFCRNQGIISFYSWQTISIVFGVTFCVCIIYYILKQICYYIIGAIFIERYSFDLWKTSYRAIMGVWGISLYLPVLWIVYAEEQSLLPFTFFCLLYIICRFVIIYKIIRIFYTKITGLFYISLYLCGLEILPLILLYKSVGYLYNFIEKSTLWH